MLSTKIKDPKDPSGKSKPLHLDIDDEVLIQHWNKKARIKWTVTYFVGILLVYAVRTAMSISATVMSIDLGWNKQISGVALSAFFFGYVTTNVAGGYLADKHGGETIIFYSAIVWASLSLMLPSLAHSNNSYFSGTTAVIVCRFLTGVFQGVFFPSVTSIFSKHVHVSERAFAYAFAQSGSPLGTICTGLFGSVIIELYGWPAVFVMSGMCSLVWVFWLRYLQRTSYSKISVDDKTNKRAKEPMPWMKLILNIHLWGLFIAYCCNSFVFFNLLSWTPAYFHDAFPQSKGWVFNVIPWLCSFIITITSGYLANVMLANGSTVIYIRKLYASIMFFGTGVLSILLNSVETFKQALFVMSLNVGLNALSSCSLSINAQDLAPNYAGALHGMINGPGALWGSVGIYMTGYILETTGSWSLVFNLIAAVSFIGGVVYFVLGSADRIV